MIFLDFFLSFFEKFWMIPYDKYTWEGQIFILRFITDEKHHKTQF